MSLPLGSLVLFAGVSPEIGDFEHGYGWPIGTLLVVVRTREESFDYGEMYVAPLEFSGERMGPSQGQMIMEEEVVPLNLRTLQSGLGTSIGQAL